MFDLPGNIMAFLGASRAKCRTYMPLLTQQGQWIKSLLTISVVTVASATCAWSPSLAQSSRVYALLYNPNTDKEWIHSIGFDGNETILMFDSSLDAQRFAGQLKKQNFPIPVAEAIEITEMLSFCRTQKYICQLILDGVVVNPPPKNNAEAGSKLYQK
jgi:hypothetical protein